METIHVQIDIPKALMPFTVLEDERERMVRNAMLIYPFIQNGTISHGRAAEILGMHKIDLIAMYGRLGLPYFNQTIDELQEDLATLESVQEGETC